MALGLGSRGSLRTGLHGAVMQDGKSHDHAVRARRRGRAGCGAESPTSCRYLSKLNAWSASVAVEPDDSGSSFSCGASMLMVANSARHRVGHKRGWIAKTSQRVIERIRAARSRRVVHAKVGAAGGCAVRRGLAKAWS